MPKGGKFLTVSADRQAADGGFVPYVVLAHGENDIAWEVEHGVCETLEELYTEHSRKEYIHEDGKTPMIPIATVVDSGWATKETYEFANSHVAVIPCKGLDQASGLPYRVSVLKTSKTDLDGIRLLLINTSSIVTGKQDEC